MMSERPRTTELYLDLEDTVINNWWDALLLHSNINRIRHILEKEYPHLTKLNIWSYAIYDTADYDLFLNTMKSSLENVFQMEIDLVHTVDQIQTMVEKYEGIMYDSRTEFMQLNNKFYSFVKFAQLYKDREFVLFDDAVPNSYLTFPDLNTIIRTIKI